MRVLIIGGGGREHALASRLHRDAPDAELFAAPGNPGIAELATCLSIAATDVEGLVATALELRPDLTVVGPEAPLALGLVDRFRAVGLPVFGPTGEASEIETSKAFAKRLLADAGVATARAEIHTDVDAALDAVRRFGAPVVVKASGLAAGKGVIVCMSLADAEHAVLDILRDNKFGDAGAEVLVEEFMEGEEISIFGLTDGHSVSLLPGLQDHKRLLDGDAGPNTGGMGAYLPVSLGTKLGAPPMRASSGVGHASAAMSASLMAAVERDVFLPTLRALAEAGRPFTGLLYAGLMITRDGPKVVEFNCRFGDPETEALLPALDPHPSLLERMLMIARGDSIVGVSPLRATRASVTIVLAAANYPERPRTGDVITLPPTQPDVTIFHAGTARDEEGRLVTAGGRVLAVTAVADTVAQAQRLALATAHDVKFAGKQMRTDIGWREIARTPSP